ncbi:hypothetical protein [Bacillus cereus group sp. N6]|uniref:hypothetical protein n=1 Tax=Bacillus cereus group sp. N6 TaxID=2794583 RepID=UPI001F5B52AE|nr:hypothetical protein [Bacillus cereus group sp. N6]
MKEHIIKDRDKAKIELTIYISYIFTITFLCIIGILNFYFSINKFIIISVYSASESAIISFISQGIINSSKMLQGSNLSDFYCIKKFEQKNYYNNLLSKFLSRNFIAILIGYYLGVIILYGLSLFTAIINTSSPNLILLDEPFVNFDIRSRKVTLDYLKDHIIQHKAILIYATHSTDTDVTSFSNKKIILKKDEQLDKVVLESDNCET